jgi:hypothetical protein
MHTDSVTQKERKYAVKEMKETKNEVIKSVKGLSDAQLNFKAAPDRWSVKECVYHIGLSETNLWHLLEGTMKSPANPDKRAEIKVSDEQLIKMMEDRSNKVKTQEPFEPKNAPWKSLAEALDDFKAKRNNHVDYMKSTTEDLRNHVLQLPFGWIDCYQLYLMIASHSNRHIQQINEVKADTNFPKN